MTALHGRTNGAICSLADEHLPGLSLRAQARSKVWDAPDRCVIKPGIEADPPQCGLALRNTNAEAELVPGFAPALRELAHPRLHIEGHPNGPLGVVRTGHRIIEEHHEPVTQKAFERALIREDEFTERCMIRRENGHHLLGLHPFGEGREAAQIAEDDRYLLPMTVEQSLVVSGGDNEIRDLGRQQAAQPANAPDL